ncbi:MAG: HD domain-containing protein [Phascolarctobacterium sp.]|nr:HD domain-containing protein [Phascolarctobacterium sp.]
MIKDLHIGDKITQACICKVIKIGIGNNGAPFARGTLEDKSGSLPFICFEASNVEKMKEVVISGVYMVSGILENSKFDAGGLQINIKRFVDILPEDDVSMLMPEGDFDKKAYEEKLQGYIRMVKTPALAMILKNVFQGDFLERFCKNPAGKQYHHAYLGGLLEHSVDVCALALSMALTMDDVNKDLVVAGALLHDIGKVREISQSYGFTYLDEGRLIGHVTMSALMVQETASKLHMQASSIDQLLHIILSHHGEKEKGSPVDCSTKEAFIVHYADEINSIMNQFDNYKGKDKWEYNKMLKRNILQKY